MDSSDTRPARDWRRHQLLLRMVRQEARTSTIAAWTGLSENQVRTLVQQHARSSTQGAPTRHRGQPPRQLGYFFRTVRRATEAAVLGCLYEMLSVLPATAVGLPPRGFPSVSRGELLCQAFEIYRATVESPVIPFEHAVLLATALANGQEISLQGCPQCDARILVDHFGEPQEWCTHCRPTATLAAIPGRRAPSPADARWRRPLIQLKLFEPFDDEPRVAAGGDPLAGNPKLPSVTPSTSRADRAARGPINPTEEPGDGTEAPPTPPDRARRPR